MEIVSILVSVTIAVVAVIAAFRAKSEAAQLSASNASLETELKQAKAQLESAQQEALEVRELRTEKARLQQEIVDVKEQIKNSNTKIEEANSKMDGMQQEVRKLEYEKTKFERDWKNAEKQLEERDDLIKQAKDSFKALSAEVLEQQSKQFMDNAGASLKEREQAVEKLVKPLSEKIETLDKARVDSASALTKHINILVEMNNMLSKETHNLSSALTYRPQVRGQWGEMQVERVLELSGLTKGVHYETQASDQQGGRTDFIVHMPHKRDILLDSKVSLNAYLESQNTESDEARDTALTRHARSMRNHADGLAKKEYWQSLPDTADFVVMVVPEFALPPAVERDPNLLDRVLQNKVVIATHSTLVALLKCVAMGWQERTVAEEALQIGELGKDLYDRLSVFARHLTGVGAALGNAVEKYNKGIGSYEYRVMPQAERFLSLGVKAAKKMPQLQTVDKSVHSLKQLSDSSSGKSEFSNEAS